MPVIRGTNAIRICSAQRQFIQSLAVSSANVPAPRDFAPRAGRFEAESARHCVLAVAVARRAGPGPIRLNGTASLPAWRWTASQSLSSGAHSRDRLARNDMERTAETSPRHCERSEAIQKSNGKRLRRFRLRSSADAVVAGARRNDGGDEADLALRGVVLLIDVDIDRRQQNDALDDVLPVDADA